MLVFVKRMGVTCTEKKKNIVRFELSFFSFHDLSSIAVSWTGRFLKVDVNLKLARNLLIYIYIDR